MLFTITTSITLKTHKPGSEFRDLTQETPSEVWKTELFQYSPAGLLFKGNPRPLYSASCSGILRQMSWEVQLRVYV